jgi:hypothetical protein
MAHDVLRNIVADIHEAGWYSLIVDETTDVSVKEQVSLCLRYVNHDFNVFEDFAGFYETAHTDAKTLVEVKEDVLLRLGLSLDNCRGQCYDGASNMSGRHSGVQARILQKCEKALYVHCCVHSLNLALQDATRSIPMIRDVLDYVKELSTIIRASAKRYALFEKLRKRLQLTEANEGETMLSTTLRPLCPTRWTVRATSMRSVVDNYDAILATLESKCNSDSGECGSKLLAC